MSEELQKIYLDFSDYEDRQEIKEQLYYLFEDENEYDIIWCNHYDAAVNNLKLEKFTQN